MKIANSVNTSCKSSIGGTSMLIDSGRYHHITDTYLQEQQRHYVQDELYYGYPVKQESGWSLNLEVHYEKARETSADEGSSNFYLCAFPLNESKEAREARKAELLAVISMRESVLKSGGLLGFMCSTFPMWKRIGMESKEKSRKERIG